MTNLNSAPSVCVTGTVNAPIEQVWQLYRPFGEMDKWWPIYETMTLEAPSKDEIGAVRTFSFKNREMTISEKLISRDDENYTIQYDLVKMAPEISDILAISTIVSMEKVSDTQTKVVWSNWLDKKDGCDSAQLEKTQSQGYQDGIAQLNRYLGPLLGKVKVTLGSIKSSPEASYPLNPYVIIQLAGQDQQKVEPHATLSSTFNKTLEFQWVNAQDPLIFSIMDAKPGSDDLMGTASFELSKLESNTPISQDLKLGADLTIAVTITIEPENNAKTVQLQQQKLEIASFRKTLEKIQNIEVKVLKTLDNLRTEEQAQWEYGSYNVGPMPKMVKGLPRSQALLPQKLSNMSKRILEFLYSEVDLPKRLQSYDSNPLEAYGALFGGYLSTPKLLETWQDDSEFCRQLIQGLNPLMIEVVKNIKQVPQSMLELEAQGKSIPQLIADKRLFVVDYKELAPFKSEGGKFFYAPYLLVYKELMANDESRLNVMAIQLERGGEGHAIYTPNSSQPNRYMFAKMHVQCADNQVHQFLYHLGLSHLAVEAIAIASHNCLPKEHPISKLLTPHFKDTIGINYLARQTLVADKDTITKDTFALGTTQGIEMVSNGWRTFDFFQFSFPEQLKARGFDEEGTDDLQDYYYREDGFLIWHAIGNYTKNLVDELYSDDAAVTKDTVVTAWAKELADPDLAAIPGFPEVIESRQLLANVLQIIIWMGSALHSAINFPQFPYTAMPPNRPSTLYKPMPEGDEDMLITDIIAALPDKDTSKFQCMFSWALSMPSETPLNKTNPLEQIYPAVASAFTEEMASISQKLKARNEQLSDAGKVPYTYLMPENIAASIDI